MHPRNAALHVRGRALPTDPQSDSLTLAACEIYPDEEVRVVDSGLYDENDLGFLYENGGDGGAAKKRAVERGFTGTILVGGSPPDVVPFVDSDAGLCNDAE